LSIKEKIEPDIIFVGNLNTSLSSIDRTSRQKNQQTYPRTKHTMDERDLTDIFRVFHPITADYTFFLAAYGTFSKIDHILGQIENLNKSKNLK
jgi:exonuclease III